MKLADATPGEIHRWLVLDGQGREHAIDADAFEVTDRLGLQFFIGDHAVGTFIAFSSFRREIADQDAPDTSGA